MLRTESLQPRKKLRRSKTFLLAALVMVAFAPVKIEPSRLELGPPIEMAGSSAGRPAAVSRLPGELKHPSKVAAAVLKREVHRIRSNEKEKGSLILRRLLQLRFCPPLGADSNRLSIGD